MTKQRRDKTISETLRTELLDSGLGIRAIGHAAGIDPTSISRFINGGRGLSQSNIDRLADWLNLELRRKDGD